MSNRMCDRWLTELVLSTMYSWLNLLSSSNISLHRWSSLVSLPNRVRLFARLIVLVLETRTRMLERAHESSYSRAHLNASTNLH